MRRALLVALVCINVALLATLVGVNLRRADAQVSRGAATTS